MKDLTAQLVRIIRRAETQGMTKYRIAKNARISPAQLTRLTHGTGGVSVETFARLADALGYDVQLSRKRAR